MTGNSVDIILSPAHDSGGAPGNVPVRDSVEAVSPDAVLFIKLIRKRIHISHFGNRSMKCRVETGDLCRIRKMMLSRPDACKVRRIMQGSQVRKFFDRGYDILVVYYRTGKFFAPVNYPVADGIDLRHVMKNSNLLIGN